MTKEFWFAALIRAVRTVAQTAVATIGTTAVISEVDWVMVASTAALAGILSILNSIATGLPEVEKYKPPEDPGPVAPYQGTAFCPFSLRSQSPPRWHQGDQAAQGAEASDRGGVCTAPPLSAGSILGPRGVRDRLALQGGTGDFP